jgi:hypothetical protein
VSNSVKYLKFGTKEERKQHLKELRTLQEKIVRKAADKEADAATKAVEEYFKEKEQK